MSKRLVHGALLCTKMARFGNGFVFIQELLMGGCSSCSLKIYTEIALEPPPLRRMLGFVSSRSPLSEGIRSRTFIKILAIENAISEWPKQDISTSMLYHMSKTPLMHEILHCMITLRASPFSPVVLNQQHRPHPPMSTLQARIHQCP